MFLRYLLYIKTLCKIDKTNTQTDRDKTQSINDKNQGLIGAQTTQSQVQNIREGCIVVFADCAELITAPSYHWLADSLTRRLRCLVSACKLPTLGPRRPRVQAGTS